MGVYLVGEVEGEGVGLFPPKSSFAQESCFFFFYTLYLRLVTVLTLH